MAFLYILVGHPALLQNRVVVCGLPLWPQRSMPKSALGLGQRRHGHHVYLYTYPSWGLAQDSGAAVFIHGSAELGGQLQLHEGGESCAGQRCRWL